jgi:hypothetical protein
MHEFTTATAGLAYGVFMPLLFDVNMRGVRLIFAEAANYESLKRESLLNHIAFLSRAQRES